MDHIVVDVEIAKTIEEKRSRQREATRRWRSIYPDRDRDSQIRSNIKRRGTRNEYYEKNKARILHRAKQYYLDHIDRYRELGRIWRYKITQKELRELWESQQGKCAICGVALKNGTDTALDHDDSTGKVRGFLCRKHNLGLGNFHHSPELLRRAIDYLGGKVE